MAVHPIRKMGDPVLRRVADPVPDPTSSAVRALLDDMIDSMHAANGVGLAAPQIGVSVRAVVFYVHERHDPEAARLGMVELLNPVITPLADDLMESWEACLSVPGLAGPVPRYRKIRYTGSAPDGSVIDRVAEDYYATVVQHECDHLDGILYPQRIEDLSRFGFIDALGLREEDVT